MESKPKVYIPENARINVENQSMQPPTTLYERTRSTIDKDVVNDIVKGKYGSEDKDATSGL